MADQEQLDILRQGVDTWNKWRYENHATKIELSKADFRGSNLSDAILRDANLCDADFRDADLTNADLSYANLSGARLIDAKFTGAKLLGAKVDNAIMWYTVLGNTDLSQTIGIETVKHYGPSILSTDTLQRFKGEIPELFLRGCGLNDVEIEASKLANPDLTNIEINKIIYRIYDLRATQAIQISSLFVSYSHGDAAFVDTLERGLNSKGVRFWRDIHDMTAGRMETQIDLAIRQNPTILVVLSKNSLNSDWVQHEVRKARELEKELGHDTLCPIALDDSWKSARWPQRVMEQIMEYNILDFSAWQDSNTFNAQFSKLLQGLNIFYKKPEK